MTRYNPKEIESIWQQRWLEEHTYEPDFEHAKKPFYNLMMFPYPSAEGLHVGNMYAFVGTDIYGRYQRMRGHDVFEPIGLDGFGIHSENYALKIDKHPMEQAEISEKNFYRQLAMIGNGFAWDERLETYDPEYYKWTQWIFIQLFKRGLAYRKKAPVNWCMSCQTVLADEQVIDHKCERCGHEVIKKDLEQWFFKITEYAERLLTNLDKIDWSERVKIAQRNWIGRSEGAMVKFPLVDIPGQEDTKHSLDIFTTRPDTMFGATFMVISPEKAQTWLDVGWQASDTAREYVADALQRRIDQKTETGKSGVDTEIFALNPINNEKIPVWISDYVLGDVGTGAIMAVPAHDQRDFEFAKKYDLPIMMVICPHYPAPTCPVLDEAYPGEGHLVASGEFDGTPSGEAREKITEFVNGERKVQYRLRDWLISRQRYWGPPIPMIFCEKCDWQPVPEEDLPVILPHIENFRPSGSGQSPLASVKEFYEVQCPKCGGLARRETDVSDTFLDSSWYFLRYPSVRHKDAAWSDMITKKWLPVDMYIGGAEHSVLHLLYTRFMTMAFCDWGLIDFEEPFPMFRAHGLLIKDGAKMSKSKGNVVNPDEYIRAYGADALRMYLMFLGPFEQGGDYRDTGIKGITRFLERVWKLASDVNSSGTDSKKLQQALHKAVKKVTEDIEILHYNTSISALMILLNEFESHREDVTREDIQVFLKLLAPFATHVTEELWQQHFGEPDKFVSVHHAPWPEYDPKMVQEDSFDLIVQVDGKVRGRVTLPIGTDEESAKKHAIELPEVKQYLTTEPKKVIYVQDRLISFVI